MGNGAGFIPVVLLAISLIVDRFAQVVTVGGRIDMTTAPVSGDEFSALGKVQRIRERAAEDWRRTVDGEPVHDQRHIVGHDCYECCALDRVELLAFAPLGEKALGRAIERVGLFFLIAAAVVFAAVWS